MTLIMLFLLVIVIYIGIPAAITIGIITLVKHEKKRAQENAIVYGPVYRAPKPPKKKLPASSVMLIIGTIFIMLSSITFVAANWFNMEPVTRVFALAGAALVAFAICGVLKAATELIQTSSAFYMIGTLIAIVAFGTSGYYKLFGEWFSFDGLGCGMFLAVMVSLAAVSAFAGQNFYKHPSFYYTGFSFVSIAVIFLCIQFSDSFEQFAIFIGMAQLIITAVLHIFKPHKGTAVENSAEIIGDISAVIYQIIAMGYVVGTTFDATWQTFSVLGILLVQLFCYGILKNQKWMFVIADMVGFYTAITISCGLEEKIGESWAMLLFGAITFVIYFVNCIIPENLTASKVISFIGFAIGTIFALCADSLTLSGINLILPVIFTAIMMGYCLHKSKDIQFVAGMALPIMPFGMAHNLMDVFYSSREALDRDYVAVFSVLTLVYMVMAVFFIFLPKISFSFYAKHPVKAHSAEYSLMAAGILAIFTITRYTDLWYISILIIVMHFAISCAMKCNITAAGSVIAFITLVKELIDVNIVSDTIASYLMLGLFAVLVIASRIVFPEACIYKKDDRMTFDVLLPTSLIALFSVTEFNEITSFLVYVAIAVLISGFIKKNTNKNLAAVLLSISAFIVSLAFITRQFLTFESSLISSKVNLGIILILGVVYRFIWRNHKEASRVISTVMFILAFSGLIFDGIVHDNMFNRIFVLAVTAAVLVFSFYAKSKTWFSVSSIALLILTILLTAKYFTSAGWWVYLLAVGVIFIAIAAANEASRKKGESIKDTVTKTFSDWTW